MLLSCWDNSKYLEMLSLDIPVCNNQKMYISLSFEVTRET